MNDHEEQFTSSHPQAGTCAANPEPSKTDAQKAEQQAAARWKEIEYLQKFEKKREDRQHTFTAAVICCTAAFCLRGPVIGCLVLVAAVLYIKIKNWYYANGGK